MGGYLIPASDLSSFHTVVCSLEDQLDQFNLDICVAVISGRRSIRTIVAKMNLFTESVLLSAGVTRVQLHFDVWFFIRFYLYQSLEHLAHSTSMLEL